MTACSLPTNYICGNGKSDKVQAKRGPYFFAIDNDVERLTGVKDTRALHYLNMLVREKKLARFGLITGEQFKNAHFL